MFFFASSNNLLHRRQFERQSDRINEERAKDESREKRKKDQHLSSYILAIHRVHLEKKTLITYIGVLHFNAFLFIDC